MTLQGSLKAFLIIFCCSQASYLCQGIIKPDLGVQECLRRAHYRHDPGKFVCRDLGLCYKHYCQQIARRCNSCKRSSVVPCLLIGKNQSDAQGANQYHLHELPEQRSKIQSDSVNATLNAVSDSLLRITTAEIECTGFLAAIPTGRRLSYAVVTAARCIVQFSVSCSTTNKRGNTSEVSQDQNTCFGRKKTRLHSVDKGFRAYSAVIRYKDRNIRIGLNSRTALVAREYIECGDCRYDFAALQLKHRQIKELGLRRGDALHLGPKSKSYLKNFSTTVVSHAKLETCKGTDNCTSRAVQGTAGVITEVQKFKICVFATNPGASTALLPGSPVLSLSENIRTSAKARVLAIATHTVRTPGPEKETSGVGEVRREPEEVPMVSGVRVTRSLLHFIREWLKDTNASCAAGELHAKYDCFPSAVNATCSNTLCLCALGWMDERKFCNEPLEISSGACEWLGDQKKASCHRRRPGNGTKAFFKRETPAGFSSALNLSASVPIPGSTKKLILVRNDVTSVEVEELLRHLISLRLLVMDCSGLQKVELVTFRNGRRLRFLSLRNNNITSLRKYAFQRNRGLLALSLANNSLTSIKYKHFAKLLRLRDLDLRSNKIESIAAKSLRMMKRLERVRFSHNRLQVVPDNLFRKNTALLEVWLDHNHLESLDAQTFSHSPNLHLINLEGNRLVTLPRGLLRMNRFLTNLYFSGNKLEALPNNLLDEQNFLEEVTLNENPDLPAAITLSTFKNSSCIYTLKDMLQKYGSQET